MHKKIIPSKISGFITPPPSKSQTMRSLLFALLANGKSTIFNYLHSPDTFAMIKAIKKLGATVKIFPDKLIIKGVNGIINPSGKIINSKNSGIILRFIGGIVSLSDQKITITGDASIKNNRVIYPLIKGLKDLKAKVHSKKSRPPITIQGPIHPGKIFINGEDSQPVSSLIITSLFLNGPTEIFVKNPGEKPWIDLTLSWLDFFKIPYIAKNYKYYKIYGNASIPAFNKKIEKDITSSYYPIILALITKSSITIENIKKNGPDEKLFSVLKDMGANIEIKENIILVKKSQKLIGKKIDVNDFIDNLPILAVLGCFANGTTVLYNGNIARKKESNRIDTIYKELKKMKANIFKTKDGLIIKKSKLHGSFLSSKNDHRIALSLIIAALAAKGPSYIKDIKCIEKSFPNFFQKIKKLGAKII